MANIVRLGLIAPLVSLIVAASAQRTITYTVQPGDSLYTIAHKHGLRLPELLEVNNLRNPHALQVGDQIKIPVKGRATAQRTAQPAAPASGWAETQQRSHQHPYRAIDGRASASPSSIAGRRCRCWGVRATGAAFGSKAARLAGCSRSTSARPSPRKQGK
jgi:LysM repeat protein